MSFFLILKRNFKKIFILLAFTAIIFFLNSNFFYNIWTKRVFIGNSQIFMERFIPITYLQIQHFTHQFDIKKAFIKRGYKEDNDQINIELSSEDIISFQNFYHDSTQIVGLRPNEVPGNINGGYLIDKSNIWRKANINFPDMDTQKIKIKLHGTSSSPVLDSVSFFNRLKWNFTKKVKPNDFDISRGGFAFKVKINSEDNFYQQKRRINLLSPWDDWNAVQNGLNKYIKKFGVISTYGEVKKLFINGQEVGPYLTIESIDKELLERDFQITNFAILKNNDDWNKGLSSAHISSSDYTSYDMEQSGVESTYKIALSKMELLMDALMKKDLDKIEQFVDIENLAKIAALVNISGTVHPILGDNARYIYDFATGRFELTYRVENEIFNISAPYPGVFENKKFITGDVNKLLDLFLKEPWFLNKRNEYLSLLVNDKNTILSYIDQEFNMQNEIFKKSSFPTRHHKFLYKQYRKNLNRNFVKVKNYLEYTKVYSTIETYDNKTFIKILHDSYTSSLINSIILCSGQKIVFDNPIELYPGIYEEDNRINQNKSVTRFEVPDSCIDSMDITKKHNGNIVDSKHIYVNFVSKVEYVDSHGLEQLSVNLVQRNTLTGTKSYLVKKGQYIVKEDVIFPYESEVTFEPGVNLIIDPDVSVLIQGDFKAIGSKNSMIKVSSKKNRSFGTFAILGSPSNKALVDLNYFHIDGGSEDIINGTYLSSQLSIHHSVININNSSFSGSTSDDGVNIKFSKVKIVNSSFFNNYADQIDLDYSDGFVFNSNFFYDNIITQDIITDGLDISGSNVFIYMNQFYNMTDKGISIGEKSNAYVTSNIFKNNNSAIVAKDDSRLCLKNNKYTNNKYDLDGYIKKKMYNKPKIYYVENSDLNINKINQENYVIENMLTELCIEEFQKIENYE